MKLTELEAQPTLHVPIGPSGSGKTTLYNKIKNENPQVQQFSFDTLRHEWYDKDDYNRAWKMSTEDKEFSNKAQQVFKDLIKSGQDVFVDNTNLTPKSRRFWVDYAKRNGYRTVAYVFNVPVDELIARQDTRPDKKVPAAAVQQQASVVKAPLDGEFDEVRPV